MDKPSSVTARKFRPQTFSQIVGQRHIVRTLSNAIARGRIAHAYLFSGTRGVGKTTTARILAKALNCKTGPTAEPCLECDNCLEITRGSSMDVIEIDGASNTGVDNIRDLKENAMFSPTKSRYKIYIIDEVHQISKAAFNALLKTLEEPPAHVVFIFATTELGKVPDTILSRCQSFEYKAISQADIAAQLVMIAKAENIEATPAAIEAVSRRARGSMRDAQSMFDQAAAYGGGKITEDDVKLILGLVDRSTLDGVMDALVSRDAARLLTFTGEISRGGADTGAFLEDISALTRDIMAVKYLPQRLEAMEPAEREAVARWAAALDADELQRFFTVLVDTAGMMRNTPQPAIALEMGLLRIIEKRGTASLAGVMAEVDRALAQAERAAPQPAYSPAAAPLVESNVEAAPEAIRRAVAGEGSGPDALLEAMKSARPMFRGLLEGATLQVKGSVVVVIVDNYYASEQLADADNRKTLEDLAAKTLGGAPRVVVEFHGEKKNGDGEPDLKKARERENSLKRQAMEMPIIQNALDIFQGEIVDFKTSRRG
ncbi:MAG: DNA polymerase III subunit gamma/tau [Nitrospinae bacterium]|nr:DNA polymerase III subunit gamma/tau [Nitrospinota bacterium]